MADTYKSSYTGAQIDSAVGKALGSESIPSGENDTFLHRNSETGDLEWVALEFANGHNF